MNDTTVLFLLGALLLMLDVLVFATSEAMGETTADPINGLFQAIRLGVADRGIPRIAGDGRFSVGNAVASGSLSLLLLGGGAFLLSRQGIRWEIPAQATFAVLVFSVALGAASEGLATTSLSGIFAGCRGGRDRKGKRDRPVAAFAFAGLIKFVCDVAVALSVENLTGGFHAPPASSAQVAAIAADVGEVRQGMSRLQAALAGIGRIRSSQARMSEEESSRLEDLSDAVRHLETQVLRMASDALTVPREAADREPRRRSSSAPVAASDCCDRLVSASVAARRAFVVVGTIEELEQAQIVEEMTSWGKRMRRLRPLISTAALKPLDTAVDREIDLGFGIRSFELVSPHRRELCRTEVRNGRTYLKVMDPQLFWIDRVLVVAVNS